MIIYDTRKAAEEAKRTNPLYKAGDMIVKVDSGFVIMSAKAYINWLLRQVRSAKEC
jgi:hypothetical protein